MSRPGQFTSRVASEHLTTLFGSSWRRHSGSNRSWRQQYRVLALGDERNGAHVTLEKIWASNPGYELPAMPQWGQLIDEVMVALAH